MRKTVALSCTCVRAIIARVHRLVICTTDNHPTACLDIAKMLAAYHHAFDRKSWETRVLYIDGRWCQQKKSALNVGNIWGDYLNKNSKNSLRFFKLKQVLRIKKQIEIAFRENDCRRCNLPRVYDISEALLVVLKKEKIEIYIIDLFIIINIINISVRYICFIYISHMLSICDFYY